jgi:hypothetical protein
VKVTLPSTKHNEDQSDSSGHHRALLIFFTGLIFAGLVLTIIELQRGAGWSPDLRKANSGDSGGSYTHDVAGTSAQNVQDWMASARSKSEFLSNILSSSHEGVIPAFDPNGAKGILRKKLEAIRFLQTKFSMLRTLQNGQEFESQVTVRFNMSNDAGQLELIAHRSESDSVVFAVEFQDDEVKTLQGLVVEFTKQSIPLGIGDLPVHDLFVFTQFSAQSNIEIVGIDGTTESMGFLVFDIELYASKIDSIDSRRTASENESNSLRGPVAIQAASALVWVEPNKLRLSSIRVFNELNKVVRVYDNFLFDDDSKPKAFRVTSIPTKSQTEFSFSELKVR